MTLEHFIIMCATGQDNLFPRRSTIKDICNAWKEGDMTILVAEREYGYGRWARIFIVGSGQGGYGNSDVAMYTRDTGYGYRNRKNGLRIHNRIIVDENGNVNPGNGVGVNEKLSVWVMK